MDKLRAIKFFCRVAEAKSFAAAAHDLDVVPSVLSKAIAALEADIKFRLFNRTTRRVSLTDNGARYYERCKRLIVELEEAEALTRHRAGQPVGRVLAGVHPGINLGLMCRIDEFLSRYPDIVVETTLTSTLSTLIDDKLDVLITLGDLSDSSFGAQKLGTTDYVVVASPGYLKVRGIPRGPEDLGRHIFIVSGRPDVAFHARWTMTRGDRTEIVYLPARTILREGVHMNYACLGGAGICRLAEIAVRPWIKSGELKVLLSDWCFAPLPIRAVFPSRKDVPAKVRVFVDFVRAIIKDREWVSRRAGAVSPHQLAAKQG